MLKGVKQIHPDEIEKESFRIIDEQLSGKNFSLYRGSVIKRVIHRTADFEYADILKVNDQAVESGIEALLSGCDIFTDTNISKSAILKKELNSLGGNVYCFVDDDDIEREARKISATRSALSVDKALMNKKIKIFAIGNAPTALIRLYELYIEKIIKPDLIIGVPVGFVNVTESKELFKNTDVPFIYSEGQKGGNNVAAAIINAIILLALSKKQR